MEFFACSWRAIACNWAEIVQNHSAYHNGYIFVLSKKQVKDAVLVVEGVAMQKVKSYCITVCFSLGKCVAFGTAKRILINNNLVSHKGENRNSP